jgi:hypothetical protein
MPARLDLLPSSPASRADPAVRSRAADFDRLALALEPQLGSLVSSVVGALREKGAAEGLRANGGWQRVGELTRASLRAQLCSFSRDTLPRRCPEADLAAVEALAGLADVEFFLNGYRLGQITLWKAWFSLIEDSPDLGVVRRRELLARGSDFFFRYADLLSDYVAEAYEGELERLRGNGEQRRLRAIIRLLEGDPLAASAVDYDLDRHHLGLVAWGEDPAAVARQLAAVLGRPLMVVLSPIEPGECAWAWISGSRALQPAEERAFKAFQPARGRIAVGLEGFGEAGFRSTHRQALRARRFSRDPGPALLRFEDIVVEALAIENEDDARAFVAHELRGIEDDSPASRRIRETLSAYFVAEYNAASAGAALGVHQQTVANRLRAAEQRLGHESIGVRRVELEMALRLRACLASE